MDSQYDLAATRLLLLDAEVAYDFMFFDWYATGKDSEDNKLLRFLGLPDTGKGWEGLQRALIRAGLSVGGGRRGGTYYYNDSVDELIARNKQWESGEIT